MNALTDVHLFLIGFTTEASWPSLHNKQNEPDRQSRATVTTRMSKEPLPKLNETVARKPEPPNVVQLACGSKSTIPICLHH